MTDTKVGWEEFEEPDGIKILERVGIGRRSQWFKALQVRLERTVALKVLRPFLSESDEFTEQFLEAGRQAAVIVHPAALPIVNVYPNQSCLAVSWCPGAPLKERPGTLSLLAASRVGEVVMDCLAVLHATGRAHGNLNPGNIFTDDAGGVWLDDFFQPPIMNDGARLYRSENKFIAPEYVASGVLDWRSDVYSLGTILRGALAPSERTPEFDAFLARMRSPEPEARGEAPADIFKVFQDMRRAIEAKTGGGVTMSRRRRMYRRVPAEFDVSMRRRSATPEETATILMKIRDIGESGVFVETEDDLIGIGSILELDFTLKGVDGNVHAFGVVRWRSTPPLPKGVGVQFMEVDQEGLARLRRFLGNR